MAEQSSQIKPVFQTADVSAGVTGTPASDIPKTTRKKEENQMADEMASAMSDLNAHNYKNFVEARDKFRFKIKEMCDHSIESFEKVERMKKAIAEL